MEKVSPKLVRRPEKSGCLFIRKLGMEKLLSDASKRAISYLESLGGQRVFPALEARECLAELEFGFPEGPTSPEGVLTSARSQFIFPAC